MNQLLKTYGFQANYKIKIRMKNSIIALVLLCIPFCTAKAQDKVNPIEILEGNWLCKVETITPGQADDTWRTHDVVVSYEPIMERNGLKQTTYAKPKETEMYYFFDAAEGKLLGMNVDENGYLWQTQMTVNDKGNFDMTKGGPMHDDSITMTNDLKIISDSELSFDHTEYKNGKEILKVKGKFYRIPDLPSE